jgi:membrane protein implicated in regulation of membrane protease activity
MAGGYWHVILITFVGFVALAAALLVPVWRFLSREEEQAEGFTSAVGDAVGGSNAAWLNDLPPAEEVSSARAVAGEEGTATTSSQK